MKFRFCGEADCPDWILLEIDTLSKLSSVKLKLLCQLVAQGLVEPPVDMEKASRLFVDSRLDVVIDLKACVACLSFILTAAVRFDCDSNVLQSELQQLGLPREHSTSIKRVLGEHAGALAQKFKTDSLRYNELEGVEARVDEGMRCAVVELSVDGERKSVVMTPRTVEKLLDDLVDVRRRMVELMEAS